MSTIVTVPDSVLREIAKPVETLDTKTKNIIKDMVKTLKETKNPIGVGLAAPQIGIPLRIFLLREKEADEPTVFINPEIIKYSQRVQHPDKKNGTYEGCLSIPHHYAPVTRSMSVTVKYQTLSTSHFALSTEQKIFTGFSAHIIQHELDHLNGILFVDRVLEQNAKLYKVEGKTWTELSL